MKWLNLTRWTAFFVYPKHTYAIANVEVYYNMLLNCSRFFSIPLYTQCIYTCIYTLLHSYTPLLDCAVLNVELLYTFTRADLCRCSEIPRAARACFVVLILWNNLSFGVYRWQMYTFTTTKNLQKRWFGHLFLRCVYENDALRNNDVLDLRLFVNSRILYGSDLLSHCSWTKKCKNKFAFW